MTLKFLSRLLKEFVQVDKELCDLMRLLMSYNNDLMIFLGQISLLLKNRKRLAKWFEKKTSSIHATAQIEL